ncbi:Hypothetical protein SMAX5B_002704 [Scophthalmus maximus]|uniref:Uncharacterized protein n=1 Tax=Scophthalmus maximus TaxID=52904 RepID=A0A2U9BYK7_SCOMX|nr:Hypothetical protein SMAX5B_002704 [Scophthalmus maximus]
MGRSLHDAEQWPRKDSAVVRCDASDLQDTTDNHSKHVNTNEPNELHQNHNMCCVHSPETLLSAHWLDFLPSTRLRFAVSVF